MLPWTRESETMESKERFARRWYGVVGARVIKAGGIARGDRWASR